MFYNSSTITRQQQQLRTLKDVYKLVINNFITDTYYTVILRSLWSHWSLNGFLRDVFRLVLFLRPELSCIDVSFIHCATSIGLL